MESTTVLESGVSLRIQPFGDSALMLDVLAEDRLVRQEATVRVRSSILLEVPFGVLDVVAGFESLLVEFDADRVEHEGVDQAVRLAVSLGFARSADATASGRVLEVPTLFGGEFGPDLEEVAAELDLTAAEVVDRFVDRPLTISLLGAAMAPMMHGVDLPADVSRTALPRTRVEGGSVMLAGSNAIISPFPGPTGWRVIGRTPLTICDIEHDPVVSYAPGDVLRFRAIERVEFESLAGAFLSSATALS
ncbi:MAG: Allophanate hydrolase subunit 1 [Frondihabitans sp.]|nr:Allophanate hydrolase subunit 1 [Frondihabitans sp.]